MQWKNLAAPTWQGRISNQAAKEAVAAQIASHAEDGQVVGIGSGSTSFRPGGCFDGADEVGPDDSWIRGRGGAFVREKLVFAAAPERFILVDESKFVPRLGANFAVPLEVIPEAANLVAATLREALGVAPTVRPAGGKDGGVITEQGGLIMDLPLEGSTTAAELNILLQTTPGITGTGLFTGYPLTVLKG